MSRIYKISIALLFLLGPHWLRAQTLSGTVYEEGTTKSIPLANVYYGGSSTGTVTNTGGEFSLPEKIEKIPLMVSYVGYYTSVVKEYSSEKKLVIYLKPKSEDLGAVVLSISDGMSRKDKERIFTREFLGVSANALSCKIANIGDVKLHYNRSKKTVTAACAVPIEVENKRLGYKLTYFLDTFTSTSATTFFTGNYSFKDLDDPSANPKKISRNRADTYVGSRKEFIRALWSNQLEERGYSLYTSRFKNKVPADSIVHVNNFSQKYVYLKDRLILVHNNNYRQLTGLSQTNGGTYIDQKGYYGTGLLWSGDMSTQRVGDTLPYEYVP